MHYLKCEDEKSHLIWYNCRKMEGGAESGFDRVKPTEYTSRLMHFKGSGRKVEVREVWLQTQVWTILAYSLSI